MNILNSVVNVVVGAVVTTLAVVGINTPLTPPSLTLSASTVSVQAGSATTITWNAKNAEACTSSDVSTGGAVSGSVTVSPTKTTTYSITCSKTQGSSTKKSEKEFDSALKQDLRCLSGSKFCQSLNQVEVKTPINTNTWQYQGSDTSDIMIFPGGNPANNQIYKGISDCPANPQGKACTELGKRCKVNTTDKSIVTTDLYKCVASSGTTSSGTSETKTVTKSITIVVVPGENTLPTSPTNAGSAGSGGGNCGDGVDNDGDGLVDAADPGCSLGANESPNPQCSDGIDNDGNGFIDFKNGDPNCTSALDNNEFGVVPPDAELSLGASALVRANESATLTWSVKNTKSGSCVLSGNNGDSWAITAAVGSQTSSPLQNETVFTLSCTNLKGDAVSESATVKIAPSFIEQ